MDLPDGDVDQGADVVVDVAVDVPGVPGGVLYTWHVPRSLGHLAVGEAVLVEYGRRQAVGVVLRDGRGGDATRPTKPVLGRVRSEGPLLTPLQARLAIHVSEHYLAPATMVVRQMLPPGELERIELVAVARWWGSGGRRRCGVHGRATGWPAATHARATDADRVLLDAIGTAVEGVPVDDLPMERNRATTLRRLRALADDGHIRCSGGCGPRPSSLASSVA